MTATIEKVVSREQTASVIRLPLDLLDASPRNPRRTMDDKGLEELAASIKQTGINQPILVRPDTWTDGLIEPRYEIVCGHRRSEAATIAGLEEVPCIVREMTDQEADEIAYVDNVQRVDVPALEEAEHLGKLLALHGAVEGVAARVGKDVAHVAKRLRLCALGECGCAALNGRLITVDHALLLARLGAAEQNAALKWCLDRNAGSKTAIEKVIEASAKSLKDDGRYRQWEPESVIRLREHIEQSSGRKLSRAPWPLDDAGLRVEAGACTNCPQNTKANRALFEDLDIEEATCADGACFEAKRAAFVTIQLSKATQLQGGRAAGGPGLKVSWKPTSLKPAVKEATAGSVVVDENGFNLFSVFKAGQWIEAKPKSCEHLRAAVTIDWSDDANRSYMGSNQKLRKPGEQISVCIAPKCKAHKKEWEKPKGENANSSQRPDPAAEKKRQADELLVGKEEASIRGKIFAAILTKIDAARAIRMVADEDGDAPIWRKKILELLPNLSGEQLEAFTVFAGAFDGCLRVDSYWIMQPEGIAGDRKDLWALAKSAGVNAQAIAAQHFHDQYRDQSSLNSLGGALVCLYPKAVAWPKDRTSKPVAKKAYKPAPKKAVAKIARQSTKKAVKPRPPVRPALKKKAKK